MFAALVTLVAVGASLLVDAASLDDTTLFPRVDMGRPLEEVVAAVTKAADVGGPGFFYLVNHGIGESVFDDAVRAAHRFFMLSDDRKSEISAIGYGGGLAPTKGYVRPAAEGEYTKDAVDVRPTSEKVSGQRNLRETFVLRYPEADHLNHALYLDDYEAFLGNLSSNASGQTQLSISHPTNRVAPVAAVKDAAKRFFLPNQWPDEREVPGFRALIERFVSEELKLSRKMFEVFAQALAGLDGNLSRELPRHEDGMMTINVARYQRTDEDGMGIADHTDWEMFTLLKPMMLSASHVDACGMAAADEHCASLSALDANSSATFSTGLEVWFQDRWVSVPVIPDAILVNQGEMLSRLSGGRFKSPVHRVRAQSERERYSLISFWGLNFDEELPDPDMPCGTVLAGEHYLQRNGFFKSLGATFGPSSAPAQAQRA
jgi:isopenicillin N synthase-like dioxygenase